MVKEKIRRDEILRLLVLLYFEEDNYAMMLNEERKSSCYDFNLELNFTSIMEAIIIKLIQKVEELIINAKLSTDFKVLSMTITTITITATVTIAVANFASIAIAIIVNNNWLEVLIATAGLNLQQSDN